MHDQAYKRDEGSFLPSPQRSIPVWYQRVPLVPFVYRTCCIPIWFQGTGTGSLSGRPHASRVELLTTGPAYRALYEAQFARQERAPLIPPVAA